MSGYANGQIPAGALVPLSGGSSLLSGAAAAWERLRADVRARYGWTPTLTDTLSAYRPYATQERIFRERYTTTYLTGRPVKVWNGVRWYLRPGKVTAAVPGTSNHGRGIAVDITGLGGFTGTRYKQLAAAAAGLGWSNVEGRSIGEAWHWVYTGPAELASAGGPVGGSVPNAPSITALTPIEEDDMYTDEDRAAAAATRQHAANAESNAYQALLLLRRQYIVDAFRNAAGGPVEPTKAQVDEWMRNVGKGGIYDGQLDEARLHIIRSARAGK